MRKNTPKRSCSILPKWKKGVKTAAHMYHPSHREYPPRGCRALQFHECISLFYWNCVFTSPNFWPGLHHDVKFLLVIQYDILAPLSLSPIHTLKPPAPIVKNAYKIVNSFTHYLLTLGDFAENGGLRNGTQQDLNKMVDQVKFLGTKRSSRCRKWGAKPRILCFRFNLFRRKMFDYILLRC